MSETTFWGDSESFLGPFVTIEASLGSGQRKGETCGDVSSRVSINSRRFKEVLEHFRRFKAILGHLWRSRGDSEQIESQFWLFGGELDEL